MALPRCTVPARRSGCDRIVLRAGSTCRRVLLIALYRVPRRAIRGGCRAVRFEWRGHGTPDFRARSGLSGWTGCFARPGWTAAAWPRNLTVTYVSSTYLLTLPKVFFAVVNSSVLAVLPRALGRRFVCIFWVAFGVVAALFLATDVRADPAADALAELTELSRLAEQTTEQIHTAQIDLDEKLAAQQVAEKGGAVSDRMAADAAAADLVRYQAAVDRLAAAAYVGGRTDTLAAALTATSPQDLIDQLAVQKTVASELTVQMAAFRSASARAAATAEGVCEVGSPSTECGR